MSQAGPTFQIDTLAIVGVGLIGGSFALALKQAGVVGQVIGVGRQAATLNKALKLGVIDEIVTPAKAAETADLIMISAPVGAFGTIFESLAPTLNPKALLTDGGSTKGNVVAAASKALGPKITQFVPAHPVAGSHESGPQAARADLYRDKQVVICPLPDNTPAGVDYIKQAWLHCGAHLVDMPVAQHDAVLASISHLPHWLASLYVTHVSRDRHAALNLQMAGAGFGDFSRIAQGSEEMWRDIFTANRPAMLEQIDQLHTLLEQAKAALVANDTDWIEAMLRESAQVRRAWGQGQLQNESGDDRL